MIPMIFFAIIIFALAIGTYTDFKTREVPDWLNYSIIFAGLGGRLIFSLASFEWSYITEGLIGFAVCFILAYLMFYSGQWGGGDSKMLMGMGALIGMNFDFEHIGIAFLFNIFVIGAIYGLLYSAFLMIRHWKAFKKEYLKIISGKKFKKTRTIVVFIAVLVAILSMFFALEIRLPLLVIAFVALCMIYFWVFVKSVENACMFKYVKPEQLTEGDWIAKNVVVDGKKICGPKDLGIEMKQIEKLISLKKKGKIKKILIKEGIPFVPSFFIAFLVSFFVGNLFAPLLGLM